MARARPGGVSPGHRSPQAAKCQSFSDLTSAEANNLIDSLQIAIGQQSGERIPGFRLDRDRALAAGVEGRRKYSGSVATLASADDLRRIDDAIARLGWTKSRFETWLQSPSFPAARFDCDPHARRREPRMVGSEEYAQERREVEREKRIKPNDHR